jgi:hypothetical protein
MAETANLWLNAQQKLPWKRLARPEGFEPPTNGFGSHYSIRLSYGRMMVRTGMGDRWMRARASAKYSEVGGGRPRLGVSAAAEPSPVAARGLIRQLLSGP